MKLMAPENVSFTATITEDELRQRLAFETLEHVGALDPDGKPVKGVTWRVLRGDGRKGGYRVTVEGPAPVRMQLPDLRKADR